MPSRVHKCVVEREADQHNRENRKPAWRRYKVEFLLIDFHGGWGNATPPQSVVLCPFVVVTGGLQFQGFGVQTLGAMPRLEFPTIHTETFGTKIRNCTEFEGRTCGTRCRSRCGSEHFSEFCFPECAKNKRSECSWGTCSAERIAACHLYNSLRTRQNHHGANPFFLAGSGHPSPIASCSLQGRCSRRALAC